MCAFVSTFYFSALVVHRNIKNINLMGLANKLAQRTLNGVKRSRRMMAEGRYKVGDDKNALYLHNHIQTNIQIKIDIITYQRKS